MLRLQLLGVKGELVEITNSLQLRLTLACTVHSVFLRKCKARCTMSRFGVSLRNVLPGHMIFLGKPANNGATANLATQRCRKMLVNSARVDALAIGAKTLESFQNAGVIRLCRPASTSLPTGLRRCFVETLQGHMNGLSGRPSAVCFLHKLRDLRI